MQNLEYYQAIFNSYLEAYKIKKAPESLYNPINYILTLGGKRLRPLLTLMASDIFDKDCKSALDAALCVEVFHNFSLIHDDIMDAAPLRRGQPTVHKKWNVNTGILSGDAMLIMAYQLLENYPPSIFSALVKLFSKTALEVCEGQQYDMDFETRTNVTVAEYLKMIEYKTAVLVGAALQMGAISAETSSHNQRAIYELGTNLGIDFQLQDDYLDTFGNPETFGKQVGGDIIENKKTFLYLKTAASNDPKIVEELIKWYNLKPQNPDEKIKTVKKLFLESGAETEIQNAVKDYTYKAFEVLNTITIPENKKQGLKQFGTWLMTRNT